MIKLILKVSIVFSFVFSSISHAGLIAADLSEDSYITYQGIDFAWASKVNTEWFYHPSGEYNQLMAPSFHQGWDYASEEQLSLLTSLSGAELLALFTNEDDGSFIHAFDYWNTLFSGSDVMPDNMERGEVASEWIWSYPDFESLTELEQMDEVFTAMNLFGADFDTIYVRAPSVRPVPEPSTLLIVALALITLVTRKSWLK